MVLTYRLFPLQLKKKYRPCSELDYSHLISETDYFFRVLLLSVLALNAILYILVLFWFYSSLIFVRLYFLVCSCCP